jgi:hypothetical protein
MTAVGSPARQSVSGGHRPPLQRKSTLNTPVVS